MSGVIQFQKAGRRLAEQAQPDPLVAEIVDALHYLGGQAHRDMVISCIAAFRRNARWSTNQPVPDLGEEATALAQVDAFYAFWYSFKSWREFPHPDEEDVEGAESREHRRWLERINSKLREKGKKEEAKRLREFVDAAYRLDPRVTARKEEERLER